ncbi:MAG TPA: hypothetical protein PKI27_01050 [Dermatophilaceae bacterium]|jgi:hypothetical protein|nr:hypothetical protein [Dermatophilaceae bacterium]
MKVKVRCSYTIEVEVPDDVDYDVQFDIEENHCPGTGVVGAALDAHREACDAKHVCWACMLGGKNEVVSVQSGEDCTTQKSAASRGSAT